MTAFVKLLALLLGRPIRCGACGHRVTVRTVVAHVREVHQ